MTTTSRSRPARRGRLGLALAPVLLALLLLGLATAASGASAAAVAGTVTDPAGDETAGGAGVDVVSLAASYDSAGTISATVTTSAPALQPSGALLVLFGTTASDGTCQTAFSESTSPALTAWGPLGDATGGGTFTPVISGTTVTLTASGAALVSQPLDCAFAATSDADFRAVEDRTDSASLVAAVTPPPATTPPPAPPAPTQPTPAPAPTPPIPPRDHSPTRPPKPAAAQLTLSAGAVAPLAANRWTAVKATVRNASGTTARAVRLRVSVPRGVQAKPSSHALGALAAGAARAAVVRIRLTRTARASSRLGLAATASGAAAARQTLTLRRRPRGAALALTVRGVRPVSRGRALAVTATVGNGGGAAASGVTLSAAGRGVSVSPARTRIATLRAGRGRSVVVRLRLGAKAASPATVRFVARGEKGLSARQAVTLQLVAPVPAMPPKDPGGVGTAPAGLGQLAFLHFVPGVLGLTANSFTGYVFTGPGWVYRGIPTGGIPACSARTAGVDASGDPTDGCLPYTYDPKTNALTIDGQPATLSADRSSLTVGDTSYQTAPLVGPGARLSISLEDISIFGIAPNQVITTSWVTLTPDGQFAFSSDTLGTFGSGTDLETSFTAISPDHRGTYTVLPNSAIQFDYADGTVKTQTLLIESAPDGGGPADPQQQGILLDGAWYFPPD